MQLAQAAPAKRSAADELLDTIQSSMESDPMSWEYRQPEEGQKAHWITKGGIFIGLTTGCNLGELHLRIWQSEDKKTNKFEQIYLHQFQKEKLLTYIEELKSTLALRALLKAEIKS